jgi:phosphopantothenoylcysteine decarboxylase/phosphopantothenate--cysteine ligase
VARILFGVSGGIAAYKACELVRLLVRAGHDVVPLVTPGAERFVRAETFTALARRPPGEDVYLHLTRADLLVVAPLTANTLAKLAHGLADSVLTEAALAHVGRVVLAPAMNPRMWASSAVQANLAVVQGRGAAVVGPGSGDTAEGEQGVGRMAEPAEIAAAVEAALAAGGAAPAATAGPLAGRSVLVTAGGTREPIDAVRYVGNRSSGRMGVALAAEAARRGAEVTLVASNLAVAVPAGVTVVQAPTAADLARETLARSGRADVILMAAAVADYRPVAPRADKRSKDADGWTVELEPTQDVLAAIGAERTASQVVIGFAADHGQPGLEKARAKRERKRCDLIVFNDVSRSDIGFDTADNEVTVIGADGERIVPKGSKAAIAASIIDEAARLVAARRPA